MVNTIPPQSYQFFLYPPRQPAEFLPGQECFILLPSDRDTGRAVVVEGPMEGSASLFHSINSSTSSSKSNRTNLSNTVVKKRYKIQYHSCGSFYHANAAKMERVYDCFPAIIFTDNTIDYRRLARSQVVRSDSVLELGCSFGLCTQVLSEHAGKVLGLDISASVIAKARLTYPHIEFEQVNVLRRYQELTQKFRGFNKIFVDIGGDRQVPALARILNFLMETIKPQLIVVKSEALYESATQHHERNDDCNEHENDDDGVIKYEGWLRNGWDGWWRNAIMMERNSDDGIQFTGPAPWFLEAKQKGFEGHPLQYPWRETKEFVPICRLFNYSSCQGRECSFDHEHCHHCLCKGHIAINCTKINSNSTCKSKVSKGKEQITTAAMTLPPPPTEQ